MNISKLIFVNKQCCSFIQHLTEFCSYVFILQQVSISWENVLAPNKRQAIIWINGDQVYWRI